MKSYTQEYKAIVVPIVLKYLPEAKIILYGLRSREDEHEGSDIDIALDAGKIIEETKITAIIGDIEESNLPIKFDIIDFHAISKHMQQEIITDGIVWQK